MLFRVRARQSARRQESLPRSRRRRLPSNSVGVIGGAVCDPLMPPVDRRSSRKLRRLMLRSAAALFLASRRLALGSRLLRSRLLGRRLRLRLGCCSFRHAVLLTVIDGDTNSAYANRRSLHLDYYSTIKKSASPTRLVVGAPTAARVAAARRTAFDHRRARPHRRSARVLCSKRSMQRNADKMGVSSTASARRGALRAVRARSFCASRCAPRTRLIPSVALEKISADSCRRRPAARAHGEKNARIAWRRFGWRRRASSAARPPTRSARPRTGAPTVRASPSGAR